MSIDWSQADDGLLGLVLAAMFGLLLVAALLRREDRRPSAIRLAPPAFVPLDPDAAEHVARELGLAFRDYLDASAGLDR